MWLETISLSDKNSQPSHLSVYHPHSSCTSHVRDLVISYVFKELTTYSL